MLFLGIGIACNVALLLILKVFQRFSIPAFPAIVVNYFVAGSFSLFFISPVRVYYDASHLWLPAFLLGLLLVSVFYLISATTEKMGVSVASVANKISVVIPVILAFLLYDDAITWMKMAGIALALLSVVFVTAGTPSATGNTASKKSYLLPLAVFIGSGIIDALVNYAQKKIVHSDIETACLSGLFFFAAGTIGLVVFLFFYPKKNISYTKVLLGGILLGTPNYFSIFFVMRAISTNILQSSVLYPIVNVCVVLGSSLCAFLFFSEKISAKNWVGIGLSMIAILLIAFSEN
jgi:drug/metabolite transporter (DMT)-like permease